VKTWYQDPATNRQLKALKFFGFSTDDKITKGLASRIIVDLFSRADNRALWEKYIFITGDQGQESPDLLPFDPDELEKAVIPHDWKPYASKIKKKTGFERERLIEMATSMLKEGVPFDDPIPTVEYAGKHFCFTGKFQFGSRTGCNDAIVRMGGLSDENVTLETNYLIVGGEISPAWAHEAYGRKIERALFYKLEGQPISLLAEEDWVKTLK
jgi:NAD-dependent DNA ligase